MSTRTGLGFDTHRLVLGRPLILGGVTVPYELGLEGHSDADALAHAITDALLGAAALGDIGKHFPDSDPRWRGADSLVILASSTRLVKAAGFAVVNVDATVICEQPMLGGFRERMTECIAAAISCPEGDVNIKFTRGEGMGYVGRGEGIAVMAIATVQSA
ncbi:MAG: 2-C-methyl-D-erythritol 2,4-cyclodiphosphate synthase [Thermoleophilaceae bacterium]|nr:2-C-methyl-D-erythritol 2,4-cyclodiphosphate synthase [Thermoleophilaceae bacterium]